MNLKKFEVVSYDKIQKINLVRTQKINDDSDYVQRKTLIQKRKVTVLQ